MDTTVYLLCQAFVCLLTFSLLYFIYRNFKEALPKLDYTTHQKEKWLNGSLVIMMMWLLFTAALSSMGFFNDFETLPPKFAVAVIPAILGMIFIARSKVVSEAIQVLPLRRLVYIQSFRIGMEILLWVCFIYHFIPVQMTLEGYNFDMFIGVTAPMVGYFLLKKGSEKYDWLKLWNVLGMILLITIVSISILSTPSPFRQFTNEPANTMISYFPFIWIPSFIVPFAFITHVLSLKQIKHKLKK